MNTEPENKRGGFSANWAVAEVDYLFARLGRYTKFVLYSKWFLVVFAVGLLTTLIALPLVSHNRSGIRMSFVDQGKDKKTAATSPVMNNPEFRGTGNKNEQFKVNGIRATQLTPTLVQIDQVEGQMVSLDGAWRSLTADTALYNQTSKIIELQGNVTLIDNQAYTFTTAHATVDTNTMDVTGNDPVTGVGPMGNLLASAFEIRDSGAHIIFTGSGAKQVHLHIDRTQKR